MNCGACECCKAGKHCVRVLKLSSKDESDAVRLWQRFAENGANPVNLKTAPAEHKARNEAQEKTEQTQCRSCGCKFPLFAYLASFLRTWGAPAINCERCR